MGKNYEIDCGEFPLNEPENACHITATSGMKHLLFKMFKFVSRP